MKFPIYFAYMKFDFSLTALKPNVGQIMYNISSTGLVNSQWTVRIHVYRTDRWDFFFSLTGCVEILVSSPTSSGAYIASTSVLWLVLALGPRLLRYKHIIKWRPSPLDIQLAS